ncbi:non-specific serine,threonine protein kinase [Sarracenia purpurea var. burkii]
MNRTLGLTKSLHVERKLGWSHPPSARLAWDTKKSSYVALKSQERAQSYIEVHPNIPPTGYWVKKLGHVLAGGLAEPSQNSGGCSAIPITRALCISENASSSSAIKTRYGGNQTYPSAISCKERAFVATWALLPLSQPGNQDIGYGCYPQER